MPNTSESIISIASPPCGLIEVFVAAKSERSASEDIAVITPHHLAVIDGISSPLREGAQPASGRNYALAIAAALQDLPADIEARAAIAALSDAVSSLRPEHAGPAGAAIAIISVARYEVWRVGDIGVRIGETVSAGEKAVDVAMTEFRAAVNLAHLAAGTPIDEIIRCDPGLKAAAPLLCAQPAFANRLVPLGYGVIDGQAVPAQFLDVFIVDPGTEIVLASDGYLSPAPSLAGAEEALTKAIEADPASIYEMKSLGKPVTIGAQAPDDRSYLRFRFPPSLPSLATPNNSHATI